MERGRSRYALKQARKDLGWFISRCRNWCEHLEELLLVKQTIPSGQWEASIAVSQREAFCVGTIELEEAQKTTSY